jgi:hypothetical protein
MVVMGDDISPIIHLRLNSDSRPIHEQNVELHKVIDEVCCGRRKQAWCRGAVMLNRRPRAVLG